MKLAAAIVATLWSVIAFLALVVCALGPLVGSVDQEQLEED